MWISGDRPEKTGQCAGEYPHTELLVNPYAELFNKFLHFGI